MLLKIRVSGSAGSDHSWGRRASIFKVTQPKKTWLELYLAQPCSVAILGLSLNIRNNETQRNKLPKGKIKLEVKTVPLQTWYVPEGSRKLRFPDFMTTAQDGGKVVSLTHRPPLPPGKAPGTHFC